MYKYIFENPPNHVEEKLDDNIFAIFLYIFLKFANCVLDPMLYLVAIHCS